MSDILVRGGAVVDGAGAPAFIADVAITGDCIEAVGQLEKAEAELVLDAAGLTVAPGFIDPHSHSDLALLEDPLATPKVAQGVTTEIVGNCGWGAFPIRSGEAREAMSALLPATEREGARRMFASLQEYRQALRERGAAVNTAALIPHGPVRMSVMGGDDRPATEEEIGAMCGLVREAVGQGAIGLSFGLLYAPGCFTPKEEMTALGRAALPPHRPLVFHVRNECDRFRESIREAIEIGREVGAPTHISHLKVADPTNWSRVGEALDDVEAARARGQRVACDQYPYTAGSAPLQTLLPSWSLEGGTGKLLARLRDPALQARIAAALAGREQIPGWDNLSLRIGWDRIAAGSAPGSEECEGRTLASIAAERGRPPHAVLFELLLATKGSAVGIYHHMSEEDVRTVMCHAAQMVGSDGLPAPGRPHPRLWGTFPRVLGRYARELGLLTLEEAVHKMSGKTAQAFGLRRRGLVRRGCYADLCIFDRDHVSDKATYDEPTRPPTGIVHVICNGVPTMLCGKRTDHRPGVWLP